MEIATGIVTLLTWAEIALLLFLLWRIARFYEHSSGRRAGSFLFLPPLILLPAGAIYALLKGGGSVGNTVSDFLLFLGGASLILATNLLGQIMVGGR